MRNTTLQFLLDCLSERLGKFSELVLQKYLPSSYEELSHFFVSIPLLDHNPAAFGSRLNFIDVDSTFCDENGGIPRRRHKRRVKVDGELCSWHRMFNAKQGRRAAIPRYSTTTMSRLTLEKTKFVLLDIAPPRCKPMILKVPSNALRREFFSGSSRHRVHIYVPLDRIPDNPRFPFLDYIV